MENFPYSAIIAYVDSLELSAKNVVGLSSRKETSMYDRGSSTADVAEMWEQISRCATERGMTSRKTLIDGCDPK